MISMGSWQKQHLQRLSIIRIFLARRKSAILRYDVMWAKEGASRQSICTCFQSVQWHVMLFLTIPVTVKKLRCRKRILLRIAVCASYGLFPVNSATLSSSDPVSAVRPNAIAYRFCRVSCDRKCTAFVQRPAFLLTILPMSIITTAQSSP